MAVTKFGFFSLFFLFSAIILTPVLLPVIASADQCTGVSDGFERCVFEGDLLRCDGGGAVHEYDRPAVRDCDNCASEYRCDLHGCGWIR